MRLTKPLIAATSLSVLLSTPVFAKDFRADVFGGYSRFPSSGQTLPDNDSYYVGLNWYTKPILDSDILPYKELPFLQNASSARLSYYYDELTGNTYSSKYQDLGLGATYFIDKFFITGDGLFRVDHENASTDKGLKSGIIGVGYKPTREWAINTSYGFGTNDIGTADNTDNFWGLGVKWVKPYSPKNAFSLNVGYKRSLTSSEDNFTNESYKTLQTLFNSGDPLMVGAKGRADDYSIGFNYYFTPKFDIGAYGNYVTSDADTINNYGLSLNYFVTKDFSIAVAGGRYDQSDATSDNYGVKLGYRF